MLYRLILSITNKMQRYTVFFLAVHALHVSGGFSAYHQELKKVNTTSDTTYMSGLLAATAGVDEFQLTHASVGEPDIHVVSDAV